MRRMSPKYRNRKSRDRRGAAMVEFALVVPVVFLLFFAALEFCRVSMIRHTADNAVYEACRTGIIPGATNAEVEAQARGVMATLGVNSVNVDVQPAAIDGDTDEVTVAVEIDLDSNSYVPNQFFGGRSIRRELTLRREGIR